MDSEQVVASALNDGRPLSFYVSWGLPPPGALFEPRRVWVIGGLACWLLLWLPLPLVAGCLLFSALLGPGGCLLLGFGLLLACLLGLAFACLLACFGPWGPGACLLPALACLLFWSRSEPWECLNRVCRIFTFLAMVSTLFH